MGSHSVTCHPAEVTFPPLPQPKLVLDLATPEGCKAELTSVDLASNFTHAVGLSGLATDPLFLQQGTKVRRYNWHSAGSLGWPFPVLKFSLVYFLK